MRLIAALAVGLMLLPACTSGGADAEVEPGRPGSSAAATAGGGGSGQTLPPAVAVSTAVDAARSAPAGRWTFTTTVDFLDSAVRQSVAVTRDYDRDVNRSRLRGDIDLADNREAEAELLPSAFAGRSTEVLRIGADIYVRTTGVATSDRDWYDLGDAPLDDLVAWKYLFVDPLGERLPLLGFLDPGGGVEIGVGTVAGDGTLSYPLRLSGQMVIAHLREEAPAVTGWLPRDLDPSEIDAVATGTVELDEDGRLLGVRIDLGSTVRAIAETVDDDFDRAFYSSAEALLSVAFDHDDAADVAAPPSSMVIEPAPILEQVAAGELGIGDCLPPGTDLRQALVPLVRCDDAHTFEVYLVTDGWAGGLDYPGRPEVRAQADEVCVEAFEGFVGVPFGNSVHSLATISPLPEGWEEGDRSIVCLAESYLPSRDTLAGAAE